MAGTVSKVFSRCVNLASSCSLFFFFFFLLFRQLKPVNKKYLRIICISRIRSCRKRSKQVLWDVFKDVCLVKNTRSKHNLSDHWYVCDSVAVSGPVIVPTLRALNSRICTDPSLLTTSEGIFSLAGPHTRLASPNARKTLREDLAANELEWKGKEEIRKKGIPDSG